MIETAVGDQGARAYLADRDVTLVECGDLATGRDVDSAVTGSPGRSGRAHAARQTSETIESRVAAAADARSSSLDPTRSRRIGK